MTLGESSRRCPFAVEHCLKIVSHGLASVVCVGTEAVVFRNLTPCLTAQCFSHTQNVPKFSSRNCLLCSNGSLHPPSFLPHAGYAN